MGMDFGDIAKTPYLCEIMRVFLWDGSDFRFVIGFARSHYRFGSAAGNLTAKTPRTPRGRKGVAVAVEQWQEAVSMLSIASPDCRRSFGAVDSQPRRGSMGVGRGRWGSSAGEVPAEARQRR